MSVVWNVAVFALTPFVMKFYDVAEETKTLTVMLVLIHNIFNSVVFPFADPQGKGMHAAGDVRFTMAVFLLTTIVRSGWKHVNMTGIVFYSKKWG